jgi:hypothetical protein
MRVTGRPCSYSPLLLYPPVWGGRVIVVEYAAAMASRCADVIEISSESKGSR